MYDPYTLLNLCLFSDPKKSEPRVPASMIGKMRIRLSTLQPGTSFKASVHFARLPLTCLVLMSCFAP